MTVTTVKIEDTELVILTRKSFDELMEKAGVLPPLPTPDADGKRPALQTCNMIIARKFVARRMKTGLTQKELARRAGVRLETICRVEGGKQRPNRETILRIDAALKEAGAAE